MEDNHELTALTTFNNCNIIYCLLLTVHGSRISRIGSKPWALIIKFFASLFSQSKTSCAG